MKMRTENHGAWAQKVKLDLAQGREFENLKTQGFMH